MSTLAEIKAALPGLSVAELSDLDGTVNFMLRVRPKPFTGRDAVQWWRSRARLDEKEAEAFAADIEAGRKEMNVPPSEPRWD